MQKPAKTLADYVVVALSPLLIMHLVGSLAFFLIQVFYRGELVHGVRWVMFWFVFAIVLISRVSIEQGKGHGRFYGAALAIATWFYLIYSHRAVIVGAILLAIVWWCADRLTKDCTFINEDEDASGQGMIQGLWQVFEKSLAPEPQLKAPPLTALELMAAANLAKMRPQTPPRPPGRSVVYFSLAALPLFGFGQLFLPADDPPARHMGFLFLALYLASALSLLVTTSFLGLRRYLRQRSAEMPSSVTFSWIKFGALVICGVLLLALILPRPGANNTWKNLTYRIEHKEHKASHYALPFNPPDEGEGAPAERPTEKHASSSDSKRIQTGSGTQSSQNGGNGSGSRDQTTQTRAGAGGGAGNQGAGGQGQPGSSGGNAPDENGTPPRQLPKIKDNIPAGGDDQPENPPSHAEAGENKIPDQDGPGKKPVLTEQTKQPAPVGKNKNPEKAQKPNVLPEPAAQQPPPPQTGNQAPKEPSHWLQKLLRWLLIITVAALILWLLIRYRKPITEALRSFMASVRAFLRKLFSFRWRRKSDSATEAVTSVVPVMEPFAAYENPFITGKDKLWPAEHLVRYTYEALLSWAKEQGIEIKPQQTPHEFCAQLMEQFPDVAPDLEPFSFYYAHTAFAKRLPVGFETESIARLWRYLGDSVELQQHSNLVA